MFEFNHFHMFFYEHVRRWWHLNNLNLYKSDLYNIFIEFFIEMRFTSYVKWNDILRYHYNYGRLSLFEWIELNKRIFTKLMANYESALVSIIDRKLSVLHFVVVVRINWVQLYWCWVPALDPALPDTYIQHAHTIVKVLKPYKWRYRFIPNRMQADQDMKPKQNEKMTTNNFVYFNGKIFSFIWITKLCLKCVL